METPKYKATDFPNRYTGGTSSIVVSSKTSGICGNCQKEIVFSEPPSTPYVQCSRCHRALKVMKEGEDADYTSE